MRKARRQRQRHWAEGCCRAQRTCSVVTAASGDATAAGSWRHGAEQVSRVLRTQAKYWRAPSGGSSPGALCASCTGSANSDDRGASEVGSRVQPAQPFSHFNVPGAPYGCPITWAECEFWRTACASLRAGAAVPPPRPQTAGGGDSARDSESRRPFHRDGQAPTRTVEVRASQAADLGAIGKWGRAGEQASDWPRFTPLSRCPRDATNFEIAAALACGEELSNKLHG